MSRVRRIARKPIGRRNYFLIDANVLADKHIPARVAPRPRDRERIAACQAWWREIDAQLNAGVARVFVPDVCIAEAFKVIAKKYYREGWFARFSSARGTPMVLGGAQKDSKEPQEGDLAQWAKSLEMKP